MTIDPNNLSATASLTFDDEFTSLSLWNGNTGTWATDFWYDALDSLGNTLEGNGEQEWYINSNNAATSSVKPWTVSNGVLSLTAAKASPAISALIGGYQYTSGEINSYHSFSQTYGYFEMRAELPAGQGFWPAFWLLPEDGSWPPELDIMEVLGNDPTTLYTTVHSNVGGVHTSHGVGTTVANTSTGYHTYAVDWEPDYITWYFDGKQTYKVATPADMNKPMYIEANLAVGGYWPGDADSTTPFPAQMKIDYIRAYSSLQQGVTLTADNTAGELLTGTPYNDTFHAGNSSVVMSGDLGSDRFVFDVSPKKAGHITDFTTGSDKLDISALLDNAGYHGGHPFADGYLKFTLTKGGTTKLYFDKDGGTGPAALKLVTTTDHVNLSHADLTWRSSSTTGVTLQANDTAGQLLTGGTGNDTLHAGHDSVVMTGGAGADSFVFDDTPWNAGHITDFTPGTDKLDVSALLNEAGYHGSQPFADGILQLAPDGSGGTILSFDSDGPGSANPWPITLTTLDHVAPSDLHLDTDFLI
jgi:beta-glucanase (GH16 family)